MGTIRTYIIMTIIMLFFGFNVPINKILVENLPPLTITSLRVFTAGIIVFAMLGFMKKLRKPGIKEWAYIIFGGLLYIVGHHFYLSTGLRETTATNAGLILGMGPLLTAILSTMLLGKIPTFIKGLGFLLGSVGVLFIVFSGDRGLSGFSIGDIYIFLSILSQALSFIVISKAAKTLDPRLLTGYMLVFGSIILFFISLWREPGGLEGIFHAPLYVWVAFFTSAVFSTAIGQMVYNSVIKKIGPAEASVFLNLSTFFSLVGSVMLLGETIQMYHLVGLLFIVAGVLCGSGTIEELMQRPFQRMNMSEQQEVRDE